MEKVKKKLKTLCRPGLHVRPEFAWHADKDPFEVRPPSLPPLLVEPG